MIIDFQAVDKKNINTLSIDFVILFESTLQILKITPTLQELQKEGKSPLAIFIDSFINILISNDKAIMENTVYFNFIAFDRIYILPIHIMYRLSF